MLTLQCLHPDAILSRQVNLDDSILGDIPRVQWMQDWRLKQPRTMKNPDGNARIENGGHYLAANIMASRQAVRDEFARQSQLFNDPRSTRLLMLNIEDPRPCFDKTPLDTMKEALKFNFKRSLAMEYERAALDWHEMVIAEARAHGFLVGSYDPCPDWCDESGGPGLCYHAAALLDFVVIPFYVHRGFNKSMAGLMPTAWFAQQWGARYDRYRNKLVNVRRLVAFCPWIECAPNTPGFNERVPLTEPYLQVQGLCAKQCGPEAVVIWDAPKNNDELKLTENALPIWRKALT